MKKTLIATLAIAAFATTASAEVVTTTTTTPNQPVHHWHHKKAYNDQVVAASPVVATQAGYRQIHIGDPTVVYHEIGTSGSQRNNTIVPMYDEPIQSVKPYEIRYDYSI